MNTSWKEVLIVNAISDKSFGGRFITLEEPSVLYIFTMLDQFSEAIFNAGEFGVVAASTARWIEVFSILLLRTLVSATSVKNMLVWKNIDEDTCYDTCLADKYTCCSVIMIYMIGYGSTN
ncbi:hypothetical protein ACJX0J_038616 [Zea mays]